MLQLLLLRSCHFKPPCPPQSAGLLLTLAPPLPPLPPNYGRTSVMAAVSSLRIVPTSPTSSQPPQIESLCNLHASNFPDNLSLPFFWRCRRERERERTHVIVRGKKKKISKFKSWCVLCCHIRPPNQHRYRQSRATIQ